MPAVSEAIVHLATLSAWIDRSLTSCRSPSGPGLDGGIGTTSPRVLKGQEAD
jgi:hypothetical protein